ncbi:MAG: hypothetical protein OEY33_04185 [Bdellovibrionales bacterium]|nr:hypothetical protein [Bdellovibrionales bacterium]
MELIKVVAEFFLISLGLGVGCFSILADTKKTGVGFQKVVSAIGGASLILGLIIHLSYEDPGDLKLFSLAYGIPLLGCLLMYLFHKDKKSPFMWGIYYIQNLSFVYLLYIFMRWSLANEGNVLFHYLFLLSSCLYLGVITYAMVLGHWYLVVPKLSEKPLLIAMKIIWFLMLSKVFALIFSFYDLVPFLMEGTRLGEGYLFNWVIFIMRLCWGYILIGIMSYFAWRLVKMRSIQSATGVFYVMTILVFVGELASIYLAYKYGLYI